MRTIRTFILRLVVDPAEPDALHGALQAVPQSEALPFTDERGLLALLRRLIYQPAETVTGEMPKPVINSEPRKE
jgi:hypothetical protein